MPNQKYCIANWKMNFTLSNAESFIQNWENKSLTNASVKTVICPSFTELSKVGQMLNGSGTELGAQNVSEESKGAFTGEISCENLQEMGCKWVIVGHSERRGIMGESDVKIASKVRRILNKNLFPILCIGETIEERNEGKTQLVLSRQLSAVIEYISPADFNRMVVAYEPVWAIGTGVNATVDIISETHQKIRNIVSELGFNSEKLPILYGGSVSDSNAEELAKIKGVDGFLIGGASLDAEKFYSIYKQL